jgi:hypothetical protein
LSGVTRTVAFESACALVETILAGDARRALVAEMSRAADLGAALGRLRDAMRSHAWKAGASHLSLGRMVREYDAITRDEGFHVLHDWDGKADRVNDDAIPVDVLNYVSAQRGSAPADPVVVSILVDYYFVNLLALLSLRIWDEGDADANLDRVNSLLATLQGQSGSGQRFVNDAETLILIATSHFEVVEIGYERLLDRVRSLDRGHRVNIALGHAASMGSHLRFGFEATYARDTVVMRDDNVADYPWLCFALAELMEEVGNARLKPCATFDVAHVGQDPSHVAHGSSRANDEQDPSHVAHGSSRANDEQDPSHVAHGFSRADRLIEALFGGLSADPRAFLGQPPSSLSAAERDRTRFADMFHHHRDALLPLFEQLRPADRAYSPLAFFFNFSHNVLKGTVVDALLQGRAWQVSFNDLLTAIPLEQDDGPRQTLATTLMGYARRNPDRIRGRLMPVIVYDASTGREAFTAAMRKLRS